MAEQAHGSGSATSTPAVRERAHPTPRLYVALAGILSAVTIIEVAIVYMRFLGGMVFPILVILSTAKFALVVMFYMHLRFDSRLFSGFFVTGLLLAVAMIVVLLALFRALL